MKYRDIRYNDGILDLFEKLKRKFVEEKNTFLSLPMGKKIVVYLARLITGIGSAVAGIGLGQSVSVYFALKQDWDEVRRLINKSISMAEADGMNQAEADRGREGVANASFGGFAKAMLFAPKNRLGVIKIAAMTIGGLISAILGTLAERKIMNAQRKALGYE